MGEMRWTDDQQEVIALRNQNILVSAAAGSGKTAVLVERILQEVTQDENPMDIDRMLVVTFTRAAAAEMRNRIGDAMERMLAQDPGNKRLQRQISLVHNAQITTIDSFCQNIIRNYFHVINLDPVFRVADETEMKIMQKEVLQEALEEAYAKAELAPDEPESQDFLQMVDAISVGRDDSAVQELVQGLYTMAQSAPWPDEWLSKAESLYEYPDSDALEQSGWMQELKQYVQQMLAEYLVCAQETCALCEAQGPEEYLDALESDVTQLEECQNLPSFPEYYAHINAVQKKRLAASKAPKELKDEIQTRRKAYMERGVFRLRDRYFAVSMKDLRAQLQEMAPVMRGLAALTRRFQAMFSEKKREEGLLDFSDLEHFALQILVDHDKEDAPSAVAKELQEYYQEIMIDEYQDSSYIQEAILTSLSRAEEGKRPYIFMVGDVKQSIYRFRQARPELFNDKYLAYGSGEGNGRKIDLHQNFRSRKMVLDSANLVFSHIMKECLGGIVYDEAASLVPGAVFEETPERTAGKTSVVLIREDNASAGTTGALQGNAAAASAKKTADGGSAAAASTKKTADGGNAAVKIADGNAVLTVGVDEKKTDAESVSADSAGSETPDEKYEPMDKLTLEIAVIGEKILNLVTRENPLYIFDKETYRPVEYRDIVILHRSPFKVSDRFIQVLSEMGIPAYSETKTGYFQVREVETILNFLRIIDNPRQDIALAAVMRSALGKFTDDEMARLRAAGRGLNFYDMLKGEMVPEALRGKVSDFLDMLRRYRMLAKEQSVYDLLQRIYRETGYYDRMSAMPAGERRAANLDMLLQRALEYANKGDFGVFSFVRYIENLQKAEVDFGEATLLNEGMNAVRILSIHKSKGLEFPVVFLAGISRNFNQSDAYGIVRDLDYGLGLDYVNVRERYKTKTTLQNFLADRSVSAMMAEEIRVLYVAMTRAKELLILTGTVDDLEKRWQQWKAQGSKYGLQDLLFSKNYLSLLMPLLCQGQASSYFGIDIWDRDRLMAQETINLAKDLVGYENLKTLDLTTCYDEEIRAALEAEDAFQYPYQTEQNISVKLTVSELKRWEQRATALEEMAEDGRDWERTEEGGGDAEDLCDFEEMVEDEGDAEDVCDFEETEEEGGNAGTICASKEIPRPSFMRAENKHTGSQRGTLYHLVLEHLPYERLHARSTQKEIAQWLEEFEAQGYISAQERADIRVQDIGHFLRSEVGRRMADAAAAGTLHREQQFMLGMPAKDVYPDVNSEEPVLVQGIIDAWFTEGEEIVLIDYKTDFLKNGNLQILADRYQKQLMYYAQALERLTGHTVRERILYSVPLAKGISV